LRIETDGVVGIGARDFKVALAIAGPRPHQQRQNIVGRNMFAGYVR